MGKERSSIYHLLSVIGILSICSAFSVYCLKGLHLDGGRVFVHLLYGELFHDDGVYRYSTLVLQSLSSIMAWPFPNEFIFPAKKYLFNFVYYFYPLASIAICYFLIEDRKSNYHLIFFPIINWGLINLPAMSFAFSSAVEIAFYFWPLFFVFIRENINWKIFCLSLFFLFQLTFIHLTGLPILFVLYFLWFYRWRKSRNRFDAIFFGLIHFSIIFVLYKGMFLSPDEGKSRILNSLIKSIDQTYIQVQLPIVFFILFAFFRKYISAYAAIGSVLIYTIFLGWTVLGLNDFEPGHFLGSAFLFRIHMSPLLFLLIILALFSFKNPKHFVFSKFSYYLFILSLIVPVSFDLFTSYNYNTALNRVRYHLAKGDGCHKVSSGEIRHFFSYFGLNGSNISDLSIALSPSLNFKTFLYGDTRNMSDEHIVPNHNACLSAMPSFIPTVLTPIEFSFINTESCSGKKMNLEFLPDTSRGREISVTKAMSFPVQDYIALFQSKDRLNFFIKEEAKKIQLRAYISGISKVKFSLIQDNKILGSQSISVDEEKSFNQVEFDFNGTFTGSMSINLEIVENNTHHMEDHVLISPVRLQ